MKFIILVRDGLGDRPNAKNKTPLEAAKTPNIDAMAREGINGIMDVISPGIRPGSDTAHLSILGYNPYTDYIGRGPLEALGADIALKEGDIALRTNFATIDNRTNRIIDRRAGRIKGPLKELEKALNGIKLPVDFTFHHTIDHRGALVLKGKNLSAKVSDSDPHELDAQINKIRALDGSKEAKETAKILNTFTEKARKVLREHPLNEKRKKQGEPPANGILMRGAGAYREIMPFEKKFGIRGSCIAATALVKGVAKHLGLDVISVPGATGDENTDIKGKFDFALKSLETRDFCLINIKATDNFSHDGDFDGKVEMIGRIDKQIQTLSKIAKKDIVLALLGDHTTPVDYKNHAGDPVPICILGPTVRKDEVKNFGERSCANGNLHRLRGNDLVPIMMNLSGLAELFGG